MGEGSDVLGQTTAIQPIPTEAVGGQGRPGRRRRSGDGWYLDPEPLDNAESTSLNNRFSAEQSATTSLTDLYTVTLHEIGHAVGLSIDPPLHSTIRGY